MTELSPAAQAVLDAAVRRGVELAVEQGLRGSCRNAEANMKAEIAAALRAAADQVRPSQQNYDEASHAYEAACLNGMAYAANELRCIAAALRAVAHEVAPFPGRYPMNEYMEGFRDAKQSVHHQLNAIAAELDGAQPPSENV